MTLSHRLLDHPFYRQWTHGEVRPEQLSRYARSYAGFIDRMPTYWQRIGDALGADVAAVIADESEHAVLWGQWSAGLPAVTDAPRMDEVLDLFATLPADGLLGAVQAFEVQQPEVARTKRDGLLQHYGLGEQDVRYFDAHLREEAHIALGARIAATLPRREGYDAGFRRGAEALYRSLDLFLA